MGPDALQRRDRRHSHRRCSSCCNALTYENNSAAQAILAGLVVGLGFFVMVVIIAVFFRTNQPGSDVKLVSRLPQEDKSGGQRHDHVKRQTKRRPQFWLKTIFSLGQWLLWCAIITWP